MEGIITYKKLFSRRSYGIAIDFTELGRDETTAGKDGSRKYNDCRTAAIMRARA